MGYHIEAGCVGHADKVSEFSFKFHCVYFFGLVHAIARLPVLERVFMDCMGDSIQHAACIATKKMEEIEKRLHAL